MRDDRFARMRDDKFVSHTLLKKNLCAFVSLWRKFFFPEAGHE